MKPWCDWIYKLRQKLLDCVLTTQVMDSDQNRVHSSLPSQTCNGVEMIYWWEGGMSTMLLSSCQIASDRFLRFRTIEPAEYFSRYFSNRCCCVMYLGVYQHYCQVQNDNNLPARHQLRVRRLMKPWGYRICREKSSSGVVFASTPGSSICQVSL